MTTRPTLRSILLLGASLGTAAPSLADVPAIWQPEVRREGTGARRDELNAMELKPFGADRWASLKGWTNGPAPTADSLKGKVVLITTWASWHPPSVAAVGRSDKVLAALGDKGLVVIAVHDAKRFEMAAKVSQERGFKCLIAQDEGGKFRQALKADLDPNFYFLDRAGNLRFADVESDVMEKAAELLVSETAEAAAKVPEAFATAVKTAKGPAVKTKAMAGALAEGDFKPPLSNIYDGAAWPARNLGSDDKPVPGLDLQGQRVPDADLFGHANTWLTPKPRLPGRVAVLLLTSTQTEKARRVRPALVALADRYPLDLVVIAVAAPEDDTNALQRQFRENPPGYSVMQDNAASGILKAAGARGEDPIVVVVSTDGTVRWQGLASDAGFRPAVEQTVSADPGVAARRTAQGR